MLLVEVELFRDQFLLIIMRELKRSMGVNKWWIHLKSVIRSLATDYSCRLNRDRFAAQTVESRVEGAIKS